MPAVPRKSLISLHVQSASLLSSWRRRLANSRHSVPIIPKSYQPARLRKVIKLRYASRLRHTYRDIACVYSPPRRTHVARAPFQAFPLLRARKRGKGASSMKTHASSVGTAKNRPKNQRTRRKTNWSVGVDGALVIPLGENSYKARAIKSGSLHSVKY